MTDIPSVAVYPPRADFAKCQDGRFCLLAETCIRWLRPPTLYQVYATFHGRQMIVCQGYVPE